MITAIEQAAFDAAFTVLLARYEQEDGAKTRATDDGREYIIVRSFTAPEGHPPEVLHTTLTQAIDAWSRNIMAYLEGRSKITWRIRPEVDDPHQADGSGPQYRVYSRLVAA